MRRVFLSPTKGVQKLMEIRDHPRAKALRAYYVHHMNALGLPTSADPNPELLRFVREGEKEASYRFLKELLDFYAGLNEVEREVFVYELLFGNTSYPFWYEGRDFRRKDLEQARKTLVKTISRLCLCGKRR